MMFGQPHGVESKLLSVLCLFDRLSENPALFTLAVR
jgi:hypothetical protein